MKGDIEMAKKKAARSRKSGATTGQGKEPTPSWVEDHLHIQDLLHKYCHALDRGTVDEVTELFHRDAVLLPAYESDEQYVGRDAVRGWYETYDRNLRANVTYLRHKAICPVIEVSGNRATSVSYLDGEAIVTGSEEPTIIIGRYDDEFVRDRGRWWFKKRVIHIHYSYQGWKFAPGREGES
jgi:hypothetical protein